MQINNRKRPWSPKHKQGTRHNPDQFYQTKEWKLTRIDFVNSEPWQQLEPIAGIKYQNKYCVECWKQKKIVPYFAIDHIIQRKKGGSDEHTNLQSLCKHHHAVKSAEEANEIKK